MHATRSSTTFFVLAALVTLGCGDSASLTGPTEEGSGRNASPSPDLSAVVELGDLGGASTVATAVNESRQVVGTSETASGRHHAFLWSEGKMVDLGTLGGSWSTAADVNDWGQATGTSITAAGEARAFFWAGGTMYELGTLGGRESHGVAINDRGDVAGYSTTADGEVHAFLWSRGQMHDLGTLGGRGSYTAAANRRGDVVGQSRTAGGETHAFLWSGGRLSGLSPGQVRSSDAVDVSENGHVLINSRSGGLGRAHLWLRGSARELESPGSGSSVAADVNARGEAVGQVTAPSRGTRAVLWRDRRALALHGSSISSSSTAMAINDTGAVTGSLRPEDAPGHRAFFWSGGSMHLLRPDALGDVPESTAGVDVAENGVVLGLASYASGETRSFLWVPSSGTGPGGSDVGHRTSSRGIVEGAPARPLRRAGSSVVASRSDATGSPLAAGTALGQAMDGWASERPHLAWPRSLEALQAE